MYYQKPKALAPKVKGGVIIDSPARREAFEAVEEY